MQQPVYFKPGRVSPKSSPASKPDGDMDSAEKEHASRLEILEQAYPETVSKCTLDGYIHEFIDELDLNFRNGDQVVSRFIERMNHDKSRHKQPLGQQVSVAEERSAVAGGTRRRKRRNSSGTLGRRESNRNFEASASAIVKAGTMPATVVTAEFAWEKRPTLSQLESQNDGSQTSSPGALSTIWQYARKMLKRHTRLETRQFAPRRQDTGNVDVQTGEDQDAIDGSVDSDDDQTDKPGPAQKGVRQQILTVPQIWLWAVEGKALRTSQTGSRPQLTIEQIPW